MTLDKIAEMRQRLKSDDRAEVIQVIHEADDLEIKALGPDIHRILVETEEPRIRNVATYALRTLGDASIVPDLIRLIRDPKTQNNRGSLVYALEPYSRVELIPFLIDLVITDNIEVRNVATIVIDNADGDMSDEDCDICIQKLDAAIPTCIEPDRLELLTYIRSFFGPEEPGK